MVIAKEGFRIACVGEAMAELMLGNERGGDTPALGFAGDTMNTAIYLKRLLKPETPVSYVTVIGQDPLSDRLLRCLEDENIATDHIARSQDKLIGLYAITTDDAGERTFSYWRSESAARTLFQHELQLNFDTLSAFDLIVLSAISLAILPHTVRLALIAELDRLRTEHGTTIVFDSNYRQALWESVEVAQTTLAAMWRITDIALPSIDDEQALFHDVDEAALLKRLRSYGIANGVLKRGATGPLSLATSGQAAGAQLSVINGETVNVVDTTAAGDSFNAGYLSAIVNGDDEMQALRAGHQCALRVIAHRGAIIPKASW